MATRKFFGEVGYVTAAVETKPGVFKEGVVEYPYYGDITRNARDLEQADKVNSDLSVSNSISIVADEYALQHFHAIQVMLHMIAGINNNTCCIPITRLAEETSLFGRLDQIV